MTSGPSVRPFILVKPLKSFRHFVLKADLKADGFDLLLSISFFNFFYFEFSNWFYSPTSICLLLSSVFFPLSFDKCKCRWMHLNPFLNSNSLERAYSFIGKLCEAAFSPTFSATPLSTTFGARFWDPTEPRWMMDFRNTLLFFGHYLCVYDNLYFL